MERTGISTTLTLADVKQHFDHWRATRIKRSKIPDGLWIEVKSLIGRYPTSQITQALQVNARQISLGVSAKRDFTFVSVRPNASSLPTTKPVPSERTNTEVTCDFEIHRPNGGILKISLFPVASLTSIINLFVES